MLKVLFICHGNICRSPMAQAVLKKMAAQRKIKMEVDSAAVSRQEIGNAVYPQANAQLVRRGIPASGHRARQVTLADYEYFDQLICMDVDNIRRLNRLLGGDPQHKISLLKDGSGHDIEVEDPWYSGRFSRVYDLIEKGCAVLLDRNGMDSNDHHLQYG